MVPLIRRDYYIFKVSISQNTVLATNIEFYDSRDTPRYMT